MADGKVVISTALDNSGIDKGVKQVSGSLGGLKSIVGKLGVAITAAFSVRQIVQFGTESVRAANKLANALKGLQSIMDGQGRSFSAAQAFIAEYTKDGLIPATNAITAYKNLAMRGYDDRQIQRVMIALKDASAFGRQASYSMGEAVQSATEGLKNENSILVDNAGVTKNVAKMWEEYAESIGTTSNNLTQQQKIQAEVNGILEESKYQAGDAQKVADTFSGRLAQLVFDFNELKVAVGNAIIPIAQQLLPVISDAVAVMTGFANSVASVVAAFFGKADITTTNEAIAESALEGADAEEKLAESITSAAKAAKKSLAGFDELNVLQSKTGDAGPGAAESGAGSVTAAIQADAQPEDPLSPKLQEIVARIKKLLAPLKEIDLTPARNAFQKLGGAISQLGETVGKALGWAWDHILLPLTTWTVEEAAPETVSALADAFGALQAVLDPVSIGLQQMFEPMKPIFAWLGETVLFIIGKIGEHFRNLEQAFQERSPEIIGIFSGIGEIIALVWGRVEPIFTSFCNVLGNACSFLSKTIGNTVGLVLDLLSGVIDFLVGIFTGDWDRAFKGLGKIAEGWKEFFGKQWSDVKENILKPFLGWLKGAFSTDWSQQFGALGEPLNAFFANVKSIFNSVKKIFSGITQFVKGVFSGDWKKAWEGVKQVFGGIWDRMVTFVKSPINAIIGFINGMIDGIASALNYVINGLNSLNIKLPDWLPGGLGGKEFGLNIPTVPYTKIPYLAQGAVLPANKPFLAMVGDQRHGTNVEAPLSTIQEAVALVMDDHIAAMMAGFEAVVQAIQEQDSSVVIGDDVIARATERYQRKMAVVRGGSV